jgi:hypothetical protein
MHEAQGKLGENPRRNSTSFKFMIRNNIYQFGFLAITNEFFYYT